MTSHILPVYAPPPEVFDRGEGVRLYTEDGKAYLDFISGISVNALGYGHKAVVQALKDQADKLWHTSNMFQVKGQKRLADRYCELTFADRVFFTNSGTEAIECALKMARHYHFTKGDADRIEIVTFTGAFHGRSYGAINAGGNPKYLEGFGPALPGFTQIPFADHDALRAAVTDRTAAVLIEPVQGEGGVREVPAQCLKGLRELCDKTGALLIYDEVQCGAGRTGRLFAHQWADGAEPDIMAVAKGVGAGFPMGACLATEAASEGMVPGTHGSTFGGNPLAMAVGNAVIDELSKPEFLEHVNRISGVLTQSLEGLMQRHSDIVLEVRGKGLLRGLKLSKAPKPVQTRARELGLLTGVAGDDVLRLAPPLVIDEADVRECVGILDVALGALREAA